MPCFAEDQKRVVTLRLLTTGTMCLLLVGILLVIRHSARRAAATQSRSAARLVVLPAFRPALRWGAWVTLVMTVLLAAQLLFGRRHWINDTGSLVVGYCMFEYMIDGFSFVFVQRSVTRQAFRRANKWAMWWGAAQAVDWVLLNVVCEEWTRWVHTGKSVLQLSWYLALVTNFRVYRRPAVLPFAWFWVLYRTTIIAIEVTFDADTDFGESALETTLYVALWAIAFAYPLLVYVTLVEDTRYWRGVGRSLMGLGPGLDAARRRSGSLGSRPSSVGQGADVLAPLLDEATERLSTLTEQHRDVLLDWAFLDVGDDVVGHGSSCTVFRGRLRGQPVAVKQYTPEALTEAVVRRRSHEVATMRSLSHPNIVALHHLCIAPPDILLVMELCAVGDLASALRSGRKWSWGVRVGMAADAARPVQFIHELAEPLIHRDIKPENFMLTSDWTLKLGDFGVSVRDVRDARKSVVGTPAFMAPELITGQRNFSTAVDVYALALVVWLVLQQQPEPFPDVDNHFQLYEAVLAGHRPPLPDAWPEDLRDVLRRAWVGDPEQRCPAADLVAVLQRIGAEVRSTERTSDGSWVSVRFTKDSGSSGGPADPEDGRLSGWSLQSEKEEL